ncbi:hypothetical protein GVY41_06560 [Frigidibacter albus]|uniref:Excalibur calcium-binding domain-containing protein n=1 Tax=Frigidibacter albus TaxID=1465486 RepID=A0A6L8VE43_9RHOB|nr:excalibur calcium-binding domain-containing protein [Frigidibacter albus]MZQ88523.1 hypothetical protein [Frigidibacter albus]NBE30668.1 hypothetical protein [Frigidibacter albus]GGH48860.1 hypothetical protein GCM10011341_10800 [Frigidibacter albus]
MTKGCSLRIVSPAALLLALAACAPTMPDSGAGVGFEDYGTYMRNNSGQAASQGSYGAATAPASAITGGPISSAPLGSTALSSTAPTGDAAIGSAALAALNATSATGSTAAPFQPLPTAPVPYQPVPTTAYQPLPSTAAPVAAAPVGGGPRISDENDFSAVASRETIESDRARIEANAAQYQQVQPTALPPRTETGPNIVEYALNASNPPGQKVYTRLGLHLSNYEKNCAQFPSQDLAQMEFLRRGGPQRDPGNLDPDGDGYACRWDPTPFQKARG